MLWEEPLSGDSHSSLAEDKAKPDLISEKSIVN